MCTPTQFFHAKEEKKQIQAFITSLVRVKANVQRTSRWQYLAGRKWCIPEEASVVQHF